MSGSSGRGFTVSHQKVALELNFSSSTLLGGYTELTIVPTDRNLKTIYLNSRQCSELNSRTKVHPFRQAQARP